MILLIDNYDSFTWNLVQAFWTLGQEVKVVTNDEMTVTAIAALAPRAIVISPGPCSPAEAGISVPAIRHFADRLPILGVCLGHQSLAAAFGARVVRAPLPMHGKLSPIVHQDTALFAGLPGPFIATRYHSLVVEEASLPRELVVTARTRPDDPTPGVIMGLALKDRPVFGVQFHPESILTEVGPQILRNFLGTLS